MKRKIIPDVISGEQEICCVAPDASAEDAARLMSDRHVAAALVLDNEDFVGILTERDLVFRVMAKGRQAKDVLVQDIMTANPITASPDDAAHTALDKMREGHFRHLPVVGDSGVIGVVSIRDLYEAFAASLKEDLQSAETLIYGDQYGGLSA